MTRIDNVFNVDRVMRLPGTMNNKVAGDPRPVVIVEANYTRRYCTEDIERFLVEPPAPPSAQPRTVPYIGPERPGDAFDARHTGNDVLAKLGFKHHSTDPAGNVNWTGPWKEPREGHSATVYADDGHTTIYSDTALGRWPALQLRRPYDPFGLLLATTYGGDASAAARDLRAKGYGDDRGLEGLVAARSPEQGEDDGPSLHGWEPTDLSLVLSDDYEAPSPSVLVRSDSVGLLYAGRVNGLLGESGSGKSFVAQAATVQAITSGDDVLYIDLEDHAASLTLRLVDLGASRAEVLEHLIYVQPDLGLSPEAQEALCGLVEGRGVALVVIDSVGEAMALQALKQNDDDDVARWFRYLPKRLAALGPAVVLVDHVPKAKDAPQGYAIGSQRKRAAIDGHSMRVEQVKPMGRGREGVAKLTTTKDRNGAHPSGMTCATFTLDARHETYSWVLAPSSTSGGEDGETFRPTVLMERVSRTLERIDGLSGRQITEAVEGKTDYVRAAIACLVDEGYVRAVPKGNGFAHELVRGFREDGSEP